MTALVSVIIPVYNGEKYIAEAVDSALGQGYRNIEIIVVNDGSSDGTLEILRSYGDRITILDQINGGPPKARNSGIALARGEYIAFLDADDIWMPQKISAQVAHLEKNKDVGTCYFSWHVWPAEDNGQFKMPEFFSTSLEKISVNQEKSGWIYNRLLFDCELLTTTVMIRASVLREVGHFDVNLWNGDDYDYWIRLSQAAKISCLEPAGALYRVVTGSVSRRARPVNDELVVIDKAIRRFGFTDPSGQLISEDKIKKRLDTLIFKYGYSHLKRGDPSLAAESFAENIKFQPLRPKLWLHLLEATIKKLFYVNPAPKPKA